MIYRSEEKDEVGSDLIHPAKAISLNKLRQNHQFEKGTFVLAEVNEIPDIIRKSIELPILVNSSIDGLSDTEILSNALVIAHLLKRKLIDGLYLKSNDQRTYLNHLSILSELLLQGAGRQVGSSIVSCPGCARSGINLEMLNGQIRELTSNSKVSISLMGCGINGYGEMMKSDIGLISSSPGKVDVYVKKQLLKAAVAEIDVVDELKEILENGIEA